MDISNGINIFAKTGFTQSHLDKLITEKYLKTIACDNQCLIFTNEVKLIKNIETDLKNNYKSLNKFFSDNMLTHKKFSDPITLFKDLLGFCMMNTKPQLINYREKIYIHKNLTKEIEAKLISKKDVMKLFNINELRYKKNLNYLDIKQFVFSRKTVYILREDLAKVRCYINSNKSQNTRDQWQPVTELIKNEKYNKFGLKVESFVKKMVELKVDSQKVENHTTFVDINRLDEICSEIDDLHLNFYTSKQFYKLLDIKSIPVSNLSQEEAKLIINFLTKLNISYKTTYYVFEFNKIYIHKKQLDNFLAEHSSKSHLMKEHDLSVAEFKRYLKDKIQPYAYSRKTILYNNVEFKNLAENKNHTKYILNNYYTKTEVKRVLDITDSALNKIIKDKKLNGTMSGLNLYFLKKDVQSLRDRKEFIKHNFVPARWLRQYKYNSAKHGYIKDIQGAIKVSGIERYVFNEHGTNYLIPLGFYNSFKKNYEKRQRIKSQNDSIDYNNSFETFIQLLRINNIKFTGHAKDTEDYWLSFTKERIESSNASPSTKKYYIRDLVTSTRILSLFCESKNVFEMHSNEINWGLLTDKNIHTARAEFSLFLKQIFKYQKENQKEIKYNTKNLKNIYKDFKVKSLPLKSKSYSPKIFLELILYCQLDIHKSNAIEDALRAIRSKNDITGVDYAYSWLYVLLHLNIAWRKSDIISIQMIDIESLNISSLNDFKKSKLSSDQVNYIIGELYTSENFVSKTGKKNNFYVNDDLKEPIANAYIICHLLNIELYPYSSNLINFSNKNNSFLKRQHNFFQNFKYEFKFENRKMNRTLITSVQKMLEEKGEGTKGLQISKLLRSHTNIDTTKVYVDLTEDDVNKLSKHLFNRGIFGFIPKILSDIVFGESNNLEITTSNISKINSVFKDIYNIEASAGFINKEYKEEIRIADELLNKGIEGCQEILNKLNLNLLPGKVEHFQCLLANSGCVKPEVDCKHCVYAIPNRLAVDGIINSLISNVNMINDTFENLTITEKKKKANIIFKELKLLNQSFEHFGQTEILSVFKNKSEDYFSILHTLDKLNNNNQLLDYVKTEYFK